MILSFALILVLGVAVLGAIHAHVLHHCRLTHPTRWGMLALFSAVLLATL